MPLSDQRRDWEDLSALDPFWAILSDPEQRFGRWDMETFLASGRTEVEAILSEGSQFELPSRHRTALDFGCGAGRLTRALAAHFEECVGLDISERMIAEAAGLNAAVENCRFAVHDEPDLRGFDDRSFDFVLSLIVLQHVPLPQDKLRYVGEFVRVLADGGLLAFQLPSRIPARHRLQPRPRLYAVLRTLGLAPETLYRRLRLNPIRMTALPVAQVGAVIEAAGGQLLDVRLAPTHGGTTSALYYVTKGEPPPFGHGPRRSNRASGR